MLPSTIALGNRAPKGPFVLNEDDPLAQGLVFWVPLVDGYFQDRALGSPNQPPVQQFNTNPMRASQVNGLAFDGAPAASIPTYSYSVGPSSFSSADDRVTIAVWGSGAATGDCIIYMGDSATANRRITIETAGSHTTTFCRFQGDVGSVFATNSGPSDPANEATQYSLSVVGDGSHFQSFLNGLGGTVASGTPGTLVNDEVELGAREGGIRWLGLIWDARVYNRVLTDEEHWQLYDPQTRWSIYHELGLVYYSFPAVSAGGFVPYPNPRYSLTAGAQSMGGGVS